MASSFVKKLFEIVENEDDSIVCWVAGGSAFEVINPKRLENEVLPKFFRHARFQSMVRQLNFYAFKKVNKERSSWVYSHECFIAGRPELLQHLKRKTNSSAYAATALGLFSLTGAKRPAIDPVTVPSTVTTEVTEKEKQGQWTVSSSDDSRSSGIKCDFLSCDSTKIAREPGHSTPTRTNETNFPNQIPRSWSHGGDISASPPRKTVRRCYSMGEVDHTCYDTDVNFDEVLSNWKSVHNFFVNKDERTGQSRHESCLSPQFSPSISPSPSSVASDDAIEEEGPYSLIEDKTHCQIPVILGQSSDFDMLLRYCLDINPWERSGKLGTDIREMLNANHFLVTEIAAYTAALTPPRHMSARALVEERFFNQLSDSSSSEVDSDSDCEQYATKIQSPDVHVSVKPTPHCSPHLKVTLQVGGEQEHKPERALQPFFRFKRNKSSCEVSTVRTFLAFALACIHAAATKEIDDVKKNMLLSCAEKWSSYAQCCL